MPTAGKIYGTIRTRHTRGAGRDRKGRIHGSRSREGGDRALPREERRDRRVSHLRRGAGGQDRGGESEVLAHRGEGPHQRRGPAVHVRFEDPEGLRLALRRDGHTQHEGRRVHPRRTRQHGRVRDGILHGELGARRHAESLRPRARPRRKRRGGRRQPLHRGARDRHGRLDTPARLVLQLRRREAVVRTRQPLRRDGVRELARPGRADDEVRRGRGDPPGSASRRSTST